jgi:hypothetical protein
LGSFNIQAWAGTFEPVKSDLSQVAPNRFLRFTLTQSAIVISRDNACLEHMNGWS